VRSRPRINLTDSSDLYYSGGIDWDFRLESDGLKEFDLVNQIRDFANGLRGAIGVRC